MIEEVLRMEHIVCRENEILELDHFSMQVFKGEIYGLLCLERHGIRKMVDLICRNFPIQYGQVFIEEKLVNNIEKGDHSQNPVTLIGSQSCLIENLEVADNLFIIGSTSEKHMIKEKKLYRKAELLFMDLEIAIDPSALISQLSVYDRLVTELLRAIVLDNHLIILWQISDLLSSEELPRFHELIQKVVKRGYSIIYIYNHHEVLRPVCDRIGIFQNGHIDKVLVGQDGIEKMITSVYAGYAYEKLQLLQTGKTKDFSNMPDVLTMHHVCTEHISDWNLTIRAGENVLLLDQSNTILTELNTLLSGRDNSYTGTLKPTDALDIKNGKSH